MDVARRMKNIRRALIGNLLSQHGGARQGPPKESAARHPMLFPYYVESGRAFRLAQNLIFPES
jgi:hypothetical protein